MTLDQELDANAHHKVSKDEINFYKSSLQDVWIILEIYKQIIHVSILYFK